MKPNLIIVRNLFPGLYLSTPNVPFFTSSKKWNMAVKFIQILMHDWRMEHLPEPSFLFVWNIHNFIP